MLNEHQGTDSATGSTRLSAEKLQKRRDQNRVSQRAFRLRKEKHTMDLEAKVEELEALLEAASHENSIAASRMNKMETELCYYRGLLFASNNPRGNFVTSYPGSDYRPSGNQFGTGGELGGYNNVPYSYAPAMVSLAAPVMGNGYQRAGSYDSCSTGGYTPAGADSPQTSSISISEPRTSPPNRNLDGSLWAYLQINTGDQGPGDVPYQE